MSAEVNTAVVLVTEQPKVTLNVQQQGKDQTSDGVFFQAASKDEVRRNDRQRKHSCQSYEQYSEQQCTKITAFTNMRKVRDWGNAGEERFKIFVIFFSNYKVTCYHINNKFYGIWILF